MSTPQDGPPAVPPLPIGFSHAGVIVADMARALAYYTRFFGFAPFYDHQADPTGDRVVIGLVGDIALELTQKGTAGRPNDTCLSFSVADVDAAYAALDGSGLAALGPPVTLPSGIRCLVFRDPDGNMLEFIDLKGPASLAEIGRRAGA